MKIYLLTSPKHHILSEHTSKKLTREEIDIYGLKPRLFKTQRSQNYYAFQIKESADFIHLKADYFIGIDWLIEGEHTIHVEPKINTKVIDHFKKQLTLEEDQRHEIVARNKKARNEIKASMFSKKEIVELNYLEMILEVMAEPKVFEKASNLVFIDWNRQQISITQRQDRLTPFLIAQFLQLLKAIVRKGLKKSYYMVEQNLNSRIKGKVLVGKHIKQNVFKNRLTSTFCTFQVFGEDNTENQFLKRVLLFVSAYVENNGEIFNGNITQIKHNIHYCSPAFEHISNENRDHEMKQIKQNPFFKEYKEALKIGEYILKKFAYNITKTSDQQYSTPPFWIDMPALFELYFYAKLLKANSEESSKIDFQFSTYGNALDFLISARNYEMIIDAKYKMQYKWGKVHSDIRQVSGYARLKKVRNKLGLEDKKNEVIDCLIIYPDLKSENDSLTFKNIASKKKPINAYNKVHKLGIYLPVI